MVLILTITTFLVITAVTISAYYFLTAETAVEQRLRAMAPPHGVGRGAARAKPQLGALGQLLTTIGHFGFGGSEHSLGQLLSTAGFRGTNATLLFVGVRTLLSFGPALAYLVPQISAGQPLGPTVGYALLLWAVGHLVCTTWLRRRARIRIRQLIIALPDSLDLMVVCLEGGLGLSATIARVGEERSAMTDPLGVEFTRVARELQEGRSREEALRALGDRNGVDDLKALAGLIIQSDRLGASMAKTLRAHADVLRTKRRQRAEEAARKLPIKMLFPLALLILPALFVVTIGPAMLTIGVALRQLSGSR